MAGTNRLVELDPESLRAFKTAVRSLDKDAKKELRQLHRKKADEVAQVASEFAPYREGRLARSVRGASTNEGGQIKAGQASVPYGPPIHWGWPARHIRPQRFIIWALATVSKESAGGFEQEYLELVLDLLKRNLPHVDTRES